MARATLAYMPVICASAVLAAACKDTSQSPDDRAEPPVEQDGPVLAPLDLIYVCGNKFLATNATGASVNLTYRVVGTNETGGRTLPPGSGEDEDHSETEIETSKRGAVELYQDDQRVAHRRNQNLPCGASASTALVATSGPEATGQWGSVFNWPSVAIHTSLLPNGKVLTFGLTGTPQVWDPATGSFAAVASPALLFCSGHSFLSDGRLVLAGGHITNGHGLPDITIFTPGTSSGSWSSSTKMRRGRWYPTTVTLANDDVVILAGKDEAGVTVEQPEVWSSGAVRVLSGATRTLPYYPRAFLAPNGRVFIAGKQQTTRYLNPTGSGSWTTVGSRLYGERDYGAAVMYDLGKILYTGGGYTTNTAEIIDLNAATPRWQWTGSMARPRRDLNATLLPTGEVLVTGGSSSTASHDVTMAVRDAEVWNPATGTWTVLSSNSIARSYHSTTLLLPDGRLLHAGGGEGGGVPIQRNAELFSPPYLFKGPRPTISAVPARVAYGTPFRVVTPDAAAIAKVSLIQIGSVTHSYNSTQRFQWLSFTRQSGALTLTVPTSRNLTPPGHYLLFVLDGNNVPSVGKIVKVGTIADPNPEPPSNAPPTAAFSHSCSGRECTFTDQSTDVTPGTVTGWQWDFGPDAEGGSIERNPTHTFSAFDSYNVTLIATDNGGATGTLTKTVTVTPPPPPVVSFTWSCDGLACTFTNSSTDVSNLTTWSWDFGDLTNSPERDLTGPHTYAEVGNYGVTLTATYGDGTTGTATNPVTVTEPPPNNPPTAEFSSSCSGLTCTFTNLSTDSEGAFTSSWNYGDGSPASATPSRTYAAAGTYNVTLTVTDDDLATGTKTHPVTVTAPPPPPPPPPISLSVTGRVDDKKYMTLIWTGARTATVDVYRDGNFQKNEVNDGRYVNSLALPGKSQYTYKVCEVGTTICSNEATVVF